MVGRVQNDLSGTGTQARIRTWMRSARLPQRGGRSFESDLIGRGVTSCAESADRGMTAGDPASARDGKVTPKKYAPPAEADGAQSLPSSAMVATGLEPVTSTM